MTHARRRPNRLRACASGHTGRFLGQGDGVGVTRTARQGVAVERRAAAGDSSARAPGEPRTRQAGESCGPIGCPLWGKGSFGDALSQADSGRPLKRLTTSQICREVLAALPPPPPPPTTIGGCDRSRSLLTWCETGSRPREASRRARRDSQAASGGGRHHGKSSCEPPMAKPKGDEDRTNRSTARTTTAPDGLSQR